MSQTANLFEIKSASLDLLALLPRHSEVDTLVEAVRQRFANRPAEAQSEPFVLDLELLDNPAALDIDALVSRLARHGIRIIGLRHPDPALATLAERHGLAWLPAGPARTHAPAADPVAEASPVATAAPAGEAPLQLPMIIDRPVRTGQQIYARGTDLVVLAMVSAGAEIIADGSIHVYAPLRGRALAGARGNTSARIFTRSMEAELVSIAGVYRTIEQTLPDSILGKSIQIYLENEKIVMSSLGE